MESIDQAIKKIRVSGLSWVDEQYLNLLQDVLADSDNMQNHHVAIEVIIEWHGLLANNSK